MNYKRILVTHTDLDGAGCAIIFNRYYPDIEIKYCDYDTIDEVASELWYRKNKYDVIYFADITPSEEYGMMLLGDPKFTFIDHHITREYLWHTPRDNVIYDTNFCGTYLAANYLDQHILRSWNDKNFILAIDAYDTWKLNSGYRQFGVYLNLLFNYYGMDKFVEKFNDMHEMNNEEYTILEVLMKLDYDYLTEKLKQGKIKTDKNGNTYFEVYVSEKGGHLGTLVNDRNFPTECEYIKVINLNDHVVGLYSEEFDVSEIAKENSGGGHLNAAGYSIKNLELIYDI